MGDVMTLFGKSKGIAQTIVPAEHREHFSNVFGMVEKYFASNPGLSKITRKDIHRNVKKIKVGLKGSNFYNQMTKNMRVSSLMGFDNNSIHETLHSVIDIRPQLGIFLMKDW